MKYEYWTVGCPTAHRTILLHCEEDSGESYATIHAPLSFNVPCPHCGATHRYLREDIKPMVTDNPPPEEFEQLL